MSGLNTITIVRCLIWVSFLFLPLGASAQQPVISYSGNEIDNYDFLYADKEHDFTDADLIELIMQEAFTHIGARYRSGGKGPEAFDCSGFTGYVFAQSDYSIGASSREQYAKNIPVERSQMRRGDLVFFTSPRSGKQVGHVGIVVSVDPSNDTFTFIHASTNRGVVVSENTEGYYARRFVGVRRVF